MNVEAPRRERRGGVYSFKSWSDAGKASRTITTPSSATTYKAKYKKSR